MTIISALLSLGFLGLSLVNAATTPDAKATPKCVTHFKAGNLTTSGYVLKEGQDDSDYVFENFYLNKENNIAWKLSEIKRQYLTVEYQTCTPNYAQESNGDDQVVFVYYGRFYLPKQKKCLAVTNPDGAPPYYLGIATCPSAQDMTTKKSIPFNFVSDENGGEVDMRWIGGTIPSKKIYQGGSAGRNCHGQFYVNGTSAIYGYNQLATGRPNTSKSEDYRVHLYCPYTSTNYDGTGYTSFLSAPIRKP